jgi:hypothetical protein
VRHQQPPVMLGGAVTGTGQWLALRSRGIGPQWIAYTAAAMAAGTTIAALVNGSGTELAAGGVTVCGVPSIEGWVQAHMRLKASLRCFRGVEGRRSRGCLPPS